jgi:hypothetical protein
MEEEKKNVKFIPDENKERYCSTSSPAVTIRPAEEGRSLTRQRVGR